MRLTRLLMVLLVAGAVCTGATAQESATRPVVGEIPAGAMAYVVINDVRALTTDIEGFLDDIGLGEMIGQEMPDGMLEAMKSAIELGEGFNPDGGFAVALMDFQQFGFDVTQFLPGGAGGGGDQPPPFAIWVPGTSLENLFADPQIEQMGDYSAIMTPGMPLFAMQRGGHIVMSLSPDVLDAVKADAASAETVLTAGEKKILTESDIAGYVNLRVAGPVLDKVLRSIEDQLAEEGGGMMAGPGMSPQYTQKMLVWYRGMLSQLEGMAVGGRFVEEGLVFDQLVRYVPDSTLGKIINAYQLVQTDLLDRLPDMPYVLAFGTRGESSQPEREKQFMGEYLGLLANMLPEDSLGEQGLADMKLIAAGLNKQVSNVQVVAGGAPDDAGVFSLGVVLQCQNAETTSGLIRELVGFTEKFIKAVAPPGEADGLEIIHTAAVETIAGVSIDTIEITDPDMQDMADYEKEEMATVLGEAKVQFRLARPDANTVVLTFGGADAFMAEALSMAAGGGNIPDQPGTRAAMKYMPANATSVMLFNLTNLGTVITRGAEALGAAEMLPPLNFTAETPVALGTAVVRDTSVHQAVFVPTDVVADVVQMGMMFMPQMGGGPGHGPHQGPPMEGGEDF